MIALSNHFSVAFSFFKDLKFYLSLVRVTIFQTKKLFIPQNLVKKESKIAWGLSLSLEKYLFCKTEMFA
jgi:hypothetical protein